MFFIISTIEVLFSKNVAKRFPISHHWMLTWFSTPCKCPCYYIKENVWLWPSNRAFLNASFNQLYLGLYHRKKFILDISIPNLWKIFLVHMESLNTFQNVIFSQLSLRVLLKKSPLSTLNFYIIPFLVKEDNQLHWYFFFEWQHAFNTSKPINATNFTNIFNTSW